METAQALPGRAARPPGQRPPALSRLRTPEPACNSTLAIPPAISARIYSAALQDMGHQSSLAVARHHIENLLAAFAHAVATRDHHSLAALTWATTISAEGPGQPARTMGAGAAIDWLAPPGQDVLLTTTGLSVHSSCRSVHYTAMYQTWEPGPALSCASIGTFHGRLDAGPQVWTWAHHTMTHHASGSASTMQNRAESHPC